MGNNYCCNYNSVPKTESQCENTFREILNAFPGIYQKDLKFELELKKYINSSENKNTITEDYNKFSTGLIRKKKLNKILTEFIPHWHELNNFYYENDILSNFNLWFLVFNFDDIDSKYSMCV